MEEINDKAVDMEKSEDGRLMSAALLRFNQLAGPKFLAGMREHNPDGSQPLTGRDTLAELEKEWMDGWFYIQATREKLEAVGVCAAPMPEDEQNKRLMRAEDVLNRIEYQQPMTGPQKQRHFEHLQVAVEEYWKTCEQWEKQRIEFMNNGVDA